MFDVVFNVMREEKKMIKDLFRKKGHWKDAKVKWVQKGTGIELELKYRCSRCGLFNLWDTPYCPFCGAKMDEVEE